ncbi:MAG: RagB/SusD family nutrient uptake outer membrane protein [Cytophagales bacterium]|nr:RagB/SusD family nutrient uptake outer membrane protein [Cytophagales bacterium]
MKRLLKITIVSIISLLTSCAEEFLDRDPYGSLNDQTFFLNEDHASQAAIACYNYLRYNNYHWALLQLELGMTDNYGTWGFGEYQDYQLAAFDVNDNPVVNGNYSRAYTGIGRCNINIQGVSAMTEEQISTEAKNKYLAEMRFLRAWWYFRLIQYYGDVPVRTEIPEDVTNKEETNIPPTAKEEVIDEVILPDLEFARDNLGVVKWPASFTGRLTLGAVYAYLIDVYLYKGDYDAAIAAGNAFEDLKEEAGYALQEDPNYVNRTDNENNSELLFVASFGPGAGSYRNFYTGTSRSAGEGLGDIIRGSSYTGAYIYPSKDLLDSYTMIDGTSINESPIYDATPDNEYKWRDPRFDVAFFTPLDEIETYPNGLLVNWDFTMRANTIGEGGYDIQNRCIYYGNSTDYVWHADIRYKKLSTVYLQLAEAYAYKSDWTNCEMYLEKVRSRARNYALANKAKYVPDGVADTDVLPAYKVTSLEEAMVAIEYESRVETFGDDAVRYFNLKRWGKLQRWAEVCGWTWDPKFFDLPYPNSAVTNNTELDNSSKGW